MVFLVTQIQWHAFEGVTDVLLERTSLSVVERDFEDIAAFHVAGAMRGSLFCLES